MQIGDMLELRITEVRGGVLVGTASIASVGKGRAVNYDGGTLGKGNAVPLMQFIISPIGAEIVATD